MRTLSLNIQSISCFLLPPTCVLCGNHSRQAVNICPPCQQSLPILPHFFKNQHFLNNPLLSMRVFGLFAYEPPIPYLITALKFHGQLTHAKLIGDLFVDKIKQWYPNQDYPNLIIPMPLHPQRLYERGFNQAVEIARPISKTLGIPMDVTGVCRRKHTRAQSGLSATERMQNIAHAFTTHKSYAHLHIAILDDVITTGHTVSTLYKTLQAAGASRIDIWCAARGVMKSSAAPADISDGVFINRGGERSEGEAKRALSPLSASTSLACAQHIIKGRSFRVFQRELL